jgi:hypothetical protein
LKKWWIPGLRQEIIQDEPVTIGIPGKKKLRSSYKRLLGSCQKDPVANPKSLPLVKYETSLDIV